MTEERVFDGLDFSGLFHEILKSGQITQANFVLSMWLGAISA